MSFTEKNIRLSFTEFAQRVVNMNEQRWTGLAITVGKQRENNADSTLIQRLDESTLFQRRVPAGILYGQAYSIYSKYSDIQV